MSGVQTTGNDRDVGSGATAEGSNRGKPRTRGRGRWRGKGKSKDKSKEDAKTTEDVDDQVTPPLPAPVPLPANTNISSTAISTSATPTISTNQEQAPSSSLESVTVVKVTTSEQVISPANPTITSSPDPKQTSPITKSIPAISSKVRAKEVRFVGINQEDQDTPVKGGGLKVAAPTEDIESSEPPTSGPAVKHKKKRKGKAKGAAAAAAAAAAACAATEATENAQSGVEGSNVPQMGVSSAAAMDGHHESKEGLGEVGSSATGAAPANTNTKGTTKRKNNAGRRRPGSGSASNPTTNCIPSESGTPMAVLSESKESGSAGPSKQEPTAGDTSHQSQQKPPTTRPAEPQSQYHHYIPRLVLREFASAEARTAEPRNPFVNVYSMDEAAINQTRVARCYGFVDMYQDMSADDAMHIEKALAILERNASTIISRVKKAQDQDLSSVVLTRIERNQVRKFLFVMKYRTPLFWAKYNRPMEEYNHIDRDSVIEFMRKNGFKKPLEVWLHTLKTILDTPIDAGSKWVSSVMQKCFVPDAQWFIFNMNESFMAFCQPQNPTIDEFVVSESAFGIHEGPTEEFAKPPGMPKSNLTNGDAKVDLSSEVQVLDSGRGWYTEFHKLAPFSPKLLLVLRSNNLRNEETKKAFRKMAETGFPGSHQWAVPSIFDHLHLEPPEPTYVSQVRHTDEDKFKFTLHKLSHKDVVLFNSVIFSNVRRNLTWKNNKAMKTALEGFLKEKRFLLPPQFAFMGREGIEKLIDVKRRTQLHKLLAILGGQQIPGAEIPAPPLSSHVKGMPMLEKGIESSPTAKGYFEIGGTAVDFLRDFTQASIVSKMRNMIGDALPPGPHRLHYRNGVLRAELAFFATLPPPVIYLHVSTWILLQARRQASPLYSTEEIMDQVMNSGEVTPQDAVANVAKKLPREHLSKLMLLASFRKVCQKETLKTGIDNVEFSCFSMFGGLISSFLIESTPWYNPSFDRSVVDPYRSTEVPKQIFMKEVETRWHVLVNGWIKSRWGAEVDDFVWKWLYHGK